MSSFPLKACSSALGTSFCGVVPSVKREEPQHIHRYIHECTFSSCEREIRAPPTIFFHLRQIVVSPGMDRLLLTYVGSSYFTCEAKLRSSVDQIVITPQAETNACPRCPSGILPSSFTPSTSHLHRNPHPHSIPYLLTPHSPLPFSAPTPLFSTTKVHTPHPLPLPTLNALPRNLQQRDHFM